jgi:hypothetical protein
LALWDVGNQSVADFDAAIRDAQTNGWGLYTTVNSKDNFGHYALRSAKEGIDVRRLWRSSFDLGPNWNTPNKWSGNFVMLNVKARWTTLALMPAGVALGAASLIFAIGDAIYDPTKALVKEALTVSVVSFGITIYGAIDVMNGGYIDGYIPVLYTPMEYPKTPSLPYCYAAGCP